MRRRLLGSGTSPASSTGGARRGPGPWPRRCPPVTGSIPWPAALGPRGFPAETPLGLQGREMFYGTGKKKKLCQQAPALPAPPPGPASARGPGGGLLPPAPLPAHGGDCSYGGDRAGAVPKTQRFAHPRRRGSQPGSCWDVTQDSDSLHPQERRGKLRQEDALGLAAPCLPWGGQAAGSPAQHPLPAPRKPGPGRATPAPPGRAWGSEPSFSP